MSVASLAASHIRSPIDPAVLLGVGGNAASGFTVPGAAGVSGGGSSGLAAGGSTASSGSLSPSLNALMLQIQQGSNALQGGAASAGGGSGIGTPDSVRHHRDRDGRDQDGPSGTQASSASSATGSGTGQSADAAASGSTAGTSGSTGGLLLGDMMQAMQTYAAIGGMLLV